MALGRIQVLTCSICYRSLCCKYFHHGHCELSTCDVMTQLVGERQTQLVLRHTPLRVHHSPVQNAPGVSFTLCRKPALLTLSSKALHDKVAPCVHPRRYPPLLPSPPCSFTAPELWTPHADSHFRVFQLDISQNLSLSFRSPTQKGLRLPPLSSLR